MRRKLRDGCDVLIGNCLDTLKTLPDESIHCCITSPPYYGLRDYGGEDEQIGLEETPEQFIENLVKVFREVKRVLHNDGTLWLNIGDSYWGGKGASGQGSPEYQNARTDTFNKGHHHIGGPKKTRPTDRKHHEIKPKDLVGIPWMLAFALRADGWYLRQDIIWSKPNPMPESVKDRCTNAHEHIFLLSKSKSYYFDNEAIRERGEMTKGNSAGSQQRNTTETHGLGGGNTGINKAKERLANELKTLGYSTRNKRDVWRVNVKPYREAHFATYPPELIEPCVLAGCPVGGTVLDPFGGSGTTAGVALKHKRNAILCELNDSYVDLMAGRIKEITGLHDGQKTLFTLFQDW